MKKAILLIGIGISIGFYLFTPEDSKLDIAYHTKTNKFHPKLARFLIGTKVGRKVSYLFVKKSGKKKMKELKKDLNTYIEKLQFE